ncbi:MAG: membrane integrity-associated transporter subunit PqiC [Roseovarius sp.]
MTRLHTSTLAAATLLLASACGGPNPDLYPVAAPQVTDTIRISFGTVEVREVSLPAYAAADEIAVEDENGKLVTDADVRWADNPERAVALEIARNLAQLSGARVASEPWPFEELPDARLEVRFESLVAGADGNFRGSGQYFVGVPDGRRERSGLFQLAVPYDLEGGTPALARARGQLVLDLARVIARDGLR